MDKNRKVFRLIGDLVKEYRGRANLTLTELSEKTNLSHATISKIENNCVQRPNPRLITGSRETKFDCLRG
ncbi:helix-turn-helix domain-containing protein [Brevibacillus sp. AF8]|uniref:helix-turn-helix domain-containing protein n=1 Tax=Brevibacillus sp. AF8 TaxID=2825881 RepID=UPI001E51538C|nr:helix-turn-helix transcriptional regulator [Brevibacillus sp. AF8]MCE0452498.1 helix-turn-helix domain-containing protein [Brevibacillus sp. AF8]